MPEYGEVMWPRVKAQFRTLRGQKQYQYMNDDFLWWQACHVIGDGFGVSAIEANRLISEFSQKCRKGERDMWKVENARTTDGWGYEELPQGLFRPPTGKYSPEFQEHVAGLVAGQTIVKTIGEYETFEDNLKEAKKWQSNFPNWAGSKIRRSQWYDKDGARYGTRMTTTPISHGDKRAKVYITRYR